MKSLLPQMLIRSLLVASLVFLGSDAALAQSNAKRKANRIERQMRRAEKHAMASISLKSILQKCQFSSDAVAPSKRNAQVSPMSSKVYADFFNQSALNNIRCHYGLSVLLNRYQIDPNRPEGSLRSRSFFVLQPIVGGSCSTSSAQNLELAYHTGLHWASNGAIEQRVEFLQRATPMRLWKNLGFVGQLALQWKLSRPERAAVPRAL